MNITRSVKKEELRKEWFLVDAKDKVLGRLSSNIAKILRGKHKPCFTPHTDAGDFVVVTNARDIKLTGKKAGQKTYRYYTGYPGGLRTRKITDLLKNNPERIIINAVRGMLPHNKLGRKLINKLKVYPGAEHPHAAQMPKPVIITKEKYGRG